MSRKTKQSKKKQKKAPENQVPRWISPLALGLLVIGTFLIRTLPSWNKVFADGQVIFRGVDPWYHMRLIDNMMVNFPVPLQWDNIISYPGGMNVGYFPLLSWIVAIPGQIFNYEVVGALLPAILGALALIPIYFICKTLWKGWVGLIACGLVMILPTELFHRTLLGFTDHHILEVVFMTITILFLILYSQRGNLKWIILGGVTFGLYMSSWTGGLLLVVPIGLWFLISIFNKLRNGNTIDSFCKHASILFGLALVIFLPNILFIQGVKIYLLFLGIVALSPLLILLLSKYLNWKVLLGIVVGVLIIAPLALKGIYPEMLYVVRSVFMNPGTTIQEATASGPRVLMAHFGISFLLCMGGLVLAFKKKENLLLIVWCTFMLILTISQRRWSYYFAINNAILVGYFIYLVSSWVHKNTKVAVVSVICIIIALVGIKGTIGIANLPHIMSEGWYNSCIWLRENTEEIEGYYDLDPNKADYGVLSWWDYGNWITRVGHRAPCSNPMDQGVYIQWQVFLAQTEEDANSYLEGIRYIMVDQPMVTNKFYAIARLAPPETPINEDIFIFKLWKEETVTWIKVYQHEEVKVFARTET